LTVTENFITFVELNSNYNKSVTMRRNQKHFCCHAADISIQTVRIVSDSILSLILLVLLGLTSLVLVLVRD
jgi:hypothetical protein